MSEEQIPEEHALAPGMRFEGDLMGYWAYHDAREPKYRTREEAEALNALHAAYCALRSLGWRDAVCCPKDGSPFLVIEAGSTGVFPCVYRGEWPQGCCFVQHAGDEWPSRPILWHPMREPVTEGKASEEIG